MGQLLVRNLDDGIVSLLKLRAAQHGKSMEAEHRSILKEALTKNENNVPSFKMLLLEIPTELEDADLLRGKDYGREIEW